MATFDHPPCDGLKEMLQAAVKSVQWTYIIFWKFCHEQGELVWGDGYYNGVIKTRKTVQSIEVSTEEAALSRSEQLRELYDSLAAGDHQMMTENQQPAIRRPSVALSPEDLTESEWFYLMCVSFTFAPGVGLVGQAYAKQEHLWLTSAHEVDSNVFTRAILAKSAHIQTVLCIPILNGVIELGTIEKVEEAIEFVRHVKLFFRVDNFDKPFSPPPKQALSSHSSNTTFSPHQFSNTIQLPNNAYSVDEDDEQEEEDDDNDDAEEEENGLDFVVEADQDKHSMIAMMEADELLRLDMSEDIRFGSPNDGSSNLFLTSHEDSCRAESTPGWSDNLDLHNPPSTQLLASEKLVQEDTHYSETVTAILNNQLTQRPNSIIPSCQNTNYSNQSSFTTWTRQFNRFPNRITTTSSSQSILKYILFTVPYLHSNINKSIDGEASESVAPTLRKATSHEELSANHVLAERRRRERLNERFVILRSLVPLVTKMDKASILGDTIEYVKQLCKKIHDLEALNSLKVAEKRKIRVIEGGNGSGMRRTGTAMQVEVSIIESDALVEMQCKHRDGLLLDVMKRLRELGVEITTIQSCVNNGMCTAEMRAKVKAKGNNGRKASIMQVKKAINQIISS
uniref:basic helix-loop-helix protein A n=1 Tax=Erigeron canadensis TaxID=72917 RepID=UPI001CB90EF5|nr:basic helix-loop-helix protein A [Erigeron canadensis]